MTERGIINTYEQLVAAGGGIAITPARIGAREQYIYGWNIYRVNAQGQKLVTDKNAAWYQHGKKWIAPPDGVHGHHKAQAAALELAKAWVAETYGELGPWKRNRMRDYVPERINKQFPLRKD